MRRVQVVHRLVSALALLTSVVLLTAPPALAGSPPNLLDHNLGFVLPHPRIHNVYWDENWNADNPQFPTGTLNSFTSKLTTNGYLNAAGQYGVGTPTFASSTLANSACLSTRAPNTVNEATIAAWLLCEVTNPFSGVPGPAARLPVSNDLYVVYLPTNTTISGFVSFPAFSVLGHNFGPFTIGPPFCEQSSSGFVEGDHWILPTAAGFIQFAMVPARCGITSTGLSAITKTASHEIVEASTDAVPGGGFIDDTFPTAGTSSQPSRFSAGEIGDLCEPGGGLTHLPAQQPPLSAQPASVALSGFTFATYWSNSADACVPAVGEFKLQSRHMSTRPNTTATIGLSWIAPRRWRDLGTVEMRLLDGRTTVGLLRFHNDGSKTGSLGLGQATGKPGTARILRTGPLSLVLAQSRLHGSGPKGRSVAIAFAVRFARSLAGHVLKLELAATDKHGLRQPFLPAGTLSIRSGR